MSTQEDDLRRLRLERLRRLQTNQNAGLDGNSFTRNQKIVINSYQNPNLNSESYTKSINKSSISPDMRSSQSVHSKVNHTLNSNSNFNYTSAPSHSDLNQEKINSYEEKQKAIEATKQAIISKILSSDAKVRLTNIKMTRPEFAANLEMQLISAYQQGLLNGQIPLSDREFKSYLVRLHEHLTRRNREKKIRFR